MIETIVDRLLRRPGMVVVTSLVLAAIAAFFGLRLSLDALPDITTNQVLVLTRAPGLTPEEVERLVTRPLESNLLGVSGVTGQRSLSRYGISSISLTFDDGVDPYRARQIVQEKLNGLGGTFPPGVEAPELGPVTGGLGEIFHFTVTSPLRTQTELFELVELRVAPLLRSVSGVVEVNSWGGARRSLEVRADPLELARYGITLRNVKDALGEATGNAPGASLLQGKSQTLLRGLAWPTSASELGASILRREQTSAEGDRADTRFVRISDVAEISESILPRLGSATKRGRGEVVYVMAQMLRGENARDVVARIDQKMDDVKKVLPEDVTIDVVYHRGHLVNATLNTVAKNLAEGGLLVIVVLLLLLGGFRAGAIVALTIPLSMLGATAGMVALGVPGNLMSLGAVDFGLLVDGAVVMVESICHALRHGEIPEDEEGRLLGHADRVRLVARSVARPVFFSVLVILLVYVPVLSLTGVDGKMFRPMAITVVLALFTSLVLSLTFVPAAAALFLRPEHVPAHDPPAIRLFNVVHGWLLRLAVPRPGLVAAGTLAALVLGAALFARAGSAFVPQLDEGDLVVQTTRAAEISLEEAVRAANRMEAALLAVPEVRDVVSRVGSPAVATDIMGYEQADVFVGLKPKSEWRPNLTREDLIDELGRVLEREDPGSEPSFTQPIQMRFNELLGGAVSDVAILIYGPELGELERLAAKVEETIHPVPGVVDARVLSAPAVPLLEVRPRPLDAAQLGLSVEEVLDHVRAVRAGIEVGVTYDGAVRVPIRLRTLGSAEPEQLKDLPVPTPRGHVVPLSSIADVLAIDTPSVIGHEQAERRIAVGFNVRGLELGDVVEAAQAAVGRAVTLPRGYRLVFGGQFQTFDDARTRIRLLVPVVVFLILGLLIWTFGAWQPALVILGILPFACVGGVIALSVRGMPISISAGIGFIALSGIAVLNGVVLMSKVIRDTSHGIPADEAMLDAARLRMRPVLMTALVAALGFIPMMLATGVGSEVQRPLATVVVGGLVSSTLLTLVILPSLYVLGVRRWGRPRVVSSEAG